MSEEKENNVEIEFLSLIGNNQDDDDDIESRMDSNKENNINDEIKDNSTFTIEDVPVTGIHHKKSIEESKNKLVNNTKKPRIVSDRGKSLQLAQRTYLKYGAIFLVIMLIFIVIILIIVNLKNK